MRRESARATERHRLRGGRGRGRRGGPGDVPRLGCAQGGLRPAPGPHDRHARRRPARGGVVGMTTMRAAVLHAAGDLRVQERAVPAPGPGEALVRVAVCGVCGSDASEYDRGPLLPVLPVTRGHEFVGVVEAVGPDTAGVAVGATVVCGAGVSCGTCKPCREGRTNLCRSYATLGLQRDGGLAGYVVAPADILLDVTASGLSTDTLGMAQPMSIAVHAVRRSGLRAGQDAVIVGAGGIGTFITVAAVATGARVLVADLNPDRLALAERLGAFATLKA